MIDVGGPAMLRAAAKNFAHVASVSRPDRYGFVLDELRARQSSRADAPRARRRDVRHDGGVRVQRSRGGSAIARPSPRCWFRRSRRCSSSRYGENPHQRAAYYAEEGARRHLLSGVEQLRGPEALLQQPERPRRRARLAFGEFVAAGRA